MEWALQDSFTVKKFDHAKEEFGPASERKGAFDLTSFDSDQGTWISLAPKDAAPVRLLHHKVQPETQTSEVAFVGILPAYPIVAKFLLNKIKDVFCILLRGTPGIGKTYFGNFFVAHLLAEGRDVFYQYDTYAVHFDSETGVAKQYNSKSTAWEELLVEYGEKKPEEGTPTARYVVDLGTMDILPHPTKIKTFLLSSPDEQNYKDYVKQRAPVPRCYFPRPSRETVKEVYVAVHGQQESDTDMDDRIAVVGLKIRDVVAKEPLKDLKERVTSYFGELRPDEQEGLLTGSNEGKARSFIIHEDPVRHVNGTYDLEVRSKAPASDYVLNLAIQSHTNIDGLWAKLRKPGNAWEQSSRGRFLESLLEKKLGEIVTEGPLQLPAVDFKTGVHSVEKVRIETISRGPQPDGPAPGTLTFFSKSNVRSFDGVCDPASDGDPPQRIGLQLTVQKAEDHAIYVEDCRDLDCGDGVGHIWLVVPLHEFIEFKNRMQSKKQQSSSMSTASQTNTPLFTPNFVEKINRVTVAATLPEKEWEAKVVCIDDFYKIANALAGVKGIGGGKSRDILEWLLKEQRFLTPLSHFTSENWQEIDGIGSEKAETLEAFCDPIGPNKLATNLRLWWFFAQP
mmetsp:Transcript_11371/g.34038  ORF Transcript_11371/g.34038 Transcript_11371/m.34038 type:complete len:621 (-) Transcript_11371:315-2177(-)